MEYSNSVQMRALQVESMVRVGTMIEVGKREERIIVEGGVGWGWLLTGLLLSSWDLTFRPFCVWA